MRFFACAGSQSFSIGGQTPRGTERGERGCDSLPLAQGAARQKHAALVEALRGHVRPTLLMLHLEVVDALPRRRTGQSISCRGPAFVPANDQSAGKRRSTRVRYGAPQLKTTLVSAA